MLPTGPQQEIDCKNWFTDQRGNSNLLGNGLVYQSAPFVELTETTGNMRFVAWIASEVPDADFRVSISEIKSDGGLASRLSSALAILIDMSCIAT